MAGIQENSEIYSTNKEHAAGNSLINEAWKILMTNGQLQINYK